MGAFGDMRVVGGGSGFVSPSAGQAAARFRIDNLSHIRSAFGESVAEEVVSKVCASLRRLMDGCAGVISSAGDGIDVGPVLPGNGNFAHRLSVSGWIEAVKEELIRAPIQTGGGAVHVWVSVELRGGDGDGASLGERAGAASDFAGDPPGVGEHWAELYRSDMALVVGALAQLDAAEGSASPDLVLAWQPVRAVDGDCLYFEALARLSAGGAVVESLSPVIAALERLGFVRIFDREVATRVLVNLEQNPGVRLGFNVSARSARWDGWWEAFASRLARRPWLAERLIVEITETASIQDVSRAVAWVDRLKSLGCWIALDDFGVGHASIRTILSLSPRIVKVDAFYLARASLSQEHAVVFERVVGLARALAQIVVVEGVETPDQARMVAALDVSWQQGRHWGGPTVSRPWCWRGGPKSGVPPEGSFSWAGPDSVVRGGWL